jgi:hypothetical protein
MTALFRSESGDWLRWPLNISICYQFINLGRNSMPMVVVTII